MTTDMEKNSSGMKFRCNVRVKDHARGLTNR